MMQYSHLSVLISHIFFHMFLWNDPGNVHVSKPNLSIGKQFKNAEGTDSFALADHAELFKNH